MDELFTLMELTRDQVQHGYGPNGMSRHDFSNLAEHHYLVTFIGWTLARHLRNNGVSINAEHVLELCMTHDLGELFGGDISMPYGAVNPDAKKAARAFETENLKFITRFFGDDKDHFASLIPELMDSQSLEGDVAKIADYLEHLYFIKRKGGLDVPGAKELSVGKIMKKIEAQTDPAKSVLQTLLIPLLENLKPETVREILLRKK